MIFKLLIVLIFLYVSISCFAQVEIGIKNGETVTGYIISENDSLIKLISLDEKVWDIPKDIIKSIKQTVITIKTNKGEKYTGTISKLPDSNYTISQSDGMTVIVPRDDVMSLSKENYVMEGFTFGFPGGFNLLYGNHFGDFSIRAEIGPLFFISGLQTNFCYNLLNSRSFESNISFGAGYTYFVGPFGREYSYSYIGAFYDMNARGFFLELGFVILGNFKNDILPITFQLGYVYRFNE